MSIESTLMELKKMLYQERVLGRGSLWSRLAARVVNGLSGRRTADLDLLSLNPHLRRDLGMEDGQSGVHIR
jgi:hypothetical protein